MLTKVLTLVVHLTVALATSRQGATDEKHWALLVAGSSGYDNYRHQADICHAYHIMRNHGIPDERIVVMMYDDIAYNKLNPIQGNIINKPNGPNVYPGVGKDYTGDDVTPEVFLKVLAGDEAGVEKLIGRKGKVIKSGPNDRVFVNFVDHGGSGIVCFPDDVLHADDFNNVLNTMYTNKQYKQMVIYVEACESGSMFNNLLRNDINIFATTAANPDESSYACYLDVKRRTYLGDVYSVKWMEDSDVEDLNTETLQQQYELVKRETHKSHVMQYGDSSMGLLSVGHFQGNKTDKGRLFRTSWEHDPNIGAVRFEDVKLEILKRTGDSDALQKLIERRDSTRKFFQDVVTAVSNFDYQTLHNMPVHFSDFRCYKESIAQIRSVCPGMNLVHNDYALRSLRALANLCETNIDTETLLIGLRIVAKMTPLCASE